MIERTLRYSLFIFLFLLASCALQVPPSGGNKDTTPPKALKFTPENYSVNFPKTDIRITFNEFIQLKDIAAQLIVSPPLKYTPETKVRSKSLIIHLDDTLLDNTTYTLNFGNAIVDNTEGNAVENFQYVFSTGKDIDSLNVAGKVENAFDTKTSKGIDVMLYKTMTDSAPMKQLPNYLGKTDAEGKFVINNVSAGDYKIFALSDTNSNYFFDNSDEAIAFSDSSVHASQTGIVLRTFKEAPKVRLHRAYSDEPGKAVIIYNHPVANTSVEILSDTSKLKLFAKAQSSKGDTIIIWYRNQLSDSLNIIVHKPMQNDTITLRLRRGDDKGKYKYVPSLVSNLPSFSENTLDFKQSLELQFNHPIEKYDFSQIRFTEDSSIKSISISLKDSLKQKLELNYPWKEKSKYVLYIPPATFTDIFGIKNDTLQYIFKTKQLTDYGTLALGLQLPLRKGNYLLQLIDEKDVIYRQSSVNKDTILHYEYLEPKTYRIKLVEDRNNNGEWDTGDYLQHLQPEQVFYYKDIITVRANWDVEVKWKLEVKD